MDRKRRTEKDREIDEERKREITCIEKSTTNLDRTRGRQMRRKT